MKKLSLADKLAKKSFESDSFQKSWAVHMQAFGPILEPAFVENYQAKVHLTAALNNLSRKEISQAASKLEQLRKYIETDADKTAWLFFMGLLNELAGNREQMISCYTYANEYEHRFYLPYMKVAKFHLDGQLYDRAEENFRAAIRCFDGTGLDAQAKLLLGSAYTNLATCLTMMHRREEAEAALVTSRTLYPNAPGRAVIEAILAALSGDRAQADACISALQSHAPAAVPEIQESVDKIFAQADPHFFPVPVDDEKIAAFWNWFGSSAADLKQQLDREEYEQAMTAIGEKLLETFPFLEESPYLGLGKDDNVYVIELHDLYFVAIHQAYEKLKAACPGEIEENWQFVLVH
jgi:tetratricopeptide (TPR) repeat protein